MKPKPKVLAEGYFCEATMQFLWSTSQEKCNVGDHVWVKVVECKRRGK